MLLPFDLYLYEVNDIKGNVTESACFQFSHWHKATIQSQQIRCLFKLHGLDNNKLRCTFIRTIKVLVSTLSRPPRPKMKNMELCISMWGIPWFSCEGRLFLIWKQALL